MTDSSAGPPSSRRYAAELSHLALAKQKRHTGGGAVETIASDPPPSETLTSALVAAGREDLLEALS